MLKQLSAVAVVGLGFIGTQACVAGTAEEETLEVGDVGQGVCASNNGVNETLAALAVAMGSELREIDPVDHLRREEMPNASYNASYTFKGVHSGKCLTSENGNIILKSCNGSNSQTFKLEHMGNEYFRLRNAASNKCMDVWNLNTSNGANIAEYNCWSGDVQKFSFEYIGSSKVVINSRLSGKVLDAWGWGTSDGTNIAQWEPTAGSNQQFVMTRTNGSSVSSGDSRIRLSHAGRVRCNSNGGCPNVDALLDLQDYAVNNNIDQNEFNATNYRNTLIASYQRQEDVEDNLLRNNPGALPDPHTLTFNSVVDNGGCGVHFVFDTNSADPQDIEHHLAFFQNGGNPYLAFYSNNGQIAIDPSGDMNSGTSTSSGSCTAASMIYDPTFSKIGKCCSVSGKYGAFQTSVFSPLIRVCAY
jgi:hypothetical protein